MCSRFHLYFKVYNTMKYSSKLSQRVKLYFSFMINHLAKEFEDNDFKPLREKEQNNIS